MGSIPLHEQRSNEKTKIMKQLEAYQEVLVDFGEIMVASLKGRNYPEFVLLRSVNDFSDGFLLSKGHCAGAKGLQAFIKSTNFEALRP